MKKYISITLAIALTTLLAGCGVKFGIESRNNWRNDWITTDDSSNGGENVNISEEIANINKLDISIYVSNVKINYYDGSDLEISGTLSKYSRGISTEKKSDKLVIIEESKRNNNINADYASSLSINIPKSFNGDIKLEFGVGEFEVNDLELNELNIESGMGQLVLNEISFNSLDLESGMGETILKTSKKTGEINIEGGMGRTEISLGDINGNLKFDGGMGSATIKVPNDAPINFKHSSGMGKVTIDAKTSNDAKYIFDLYVGMGSIEVTN